MARSKSSQRWLREHFADEYVKQAQSQGYRSRAVFKLKEINDKDRILRPGMTVVDLGAAPGGWSQFAIQQVGEKGMVFAMDILPIDDLNGVTFLQGDFREQPVLEKLLTLLNERPVDIVISDMAPNISGIKAVDQPGSIYLSELALDFATHCLKHGGDFLVKTFQGEGFDSFLQDLRSAFTQVVVRKPKASRARSTELYLLARNYRL